MTQGEDHTKWAHNQCCAVDLLENRSLTFSTKCKNCCRVGVWDVRAYVLLSVTESLV